jgi:hypothetical protein
VPTFLSDPPPAVYLVLVAAAVVTGAVAARRQDRKSLTLFGVAAGLLLVVFLIDRLVESPREGAVAAIKSMAQAVNDRNPDAFTAPVADTFEYVGGPGSRAVTRAQLKTSGLWGLLREHSITVNVKDFAREDVQEIDPNTVEIGFVGQGHSPTGMMPVYFRATFARQPDGRMRLTRLASFDIVSRTGKPTSLGPDFP